MAVMHRHGPPVAAQTPNYSIAVQRICNNFWG